MKTTPTHCKMSFVLFIDELYTKTHLLSNIGKIVRSVSECIPESSSDFEAPEGAK
jgi:hypothetical protein